MVSRSKNYWDSMQVPKGVLGRSRLWKSEGPWRLWEMLVSSQSIQLGMDSLLRFSFTEGHQVSLLMRFLLISGFHLGEQAGLCELLGNQEPIHQLS